MARSLLAILDQPEAAASVLDIAGMAATRLGLAPLRVLVIRHPAAEGVMPTEDVVSDVDLAGRAEAEETRIEAIRAIFDAWVSVGGHGDWTERTGETEPLVAEAAEEGGGAIAVGHGTGVERDARQAMTVALFEARLPSIFVPQGAKGLIGRVIAIGWKPSASAEHAIASALPFLLKAERVVVLMGDEGAVESAVLPETPFATLRAAGVPLTTHAFMLAGRSIGHALLQEAHAVGADMLVMGAYTRARWREFLLGGATREILSEADLPVLMQH